jgi:hypothetical protein
MRSDTDSSQKRKRQPTKRFDDETFPQGQPRRKGKGATGGLLLDDGSIISYEPSVGVALLPQQRNAVPPQRPRTGRAVEGLLHQGGGSPEALALLSSHLDGLSQDQTQVLPQVQQDRKCNCKNSKCLKLYCECFASGKYCDGCNCRDCQNNNLHEDVRQVAVASVLERNPNAFRPKVQALRGAKEGVVVDVKHHKGCNCKKSNCLKKYCECFQAGVLCTESCRCQGCKNYHGSPFKQGAPNATVLRRAGKSLSPDKQLLPHSTPQTQHVMMTPGNTSPLVPGLSEFGQAMLPHVPLGEGRQQQPGASPLTSEQIQTITAMCLTDVINPTVLKQTCMLMMLLADENLLEYVNGNNEIDSEKRLKEIYQEQKLAIDREFVDTSQKILETIRAKLEERREKFQMHQNALYRTFKEK